MRRYLCKFCGGVVDAVGASAECKSCEVVFPDVAKLVAYVDEVSDKNGEQVEVCGIPSVVEVGDTVSFGAYEQGSGVLPIEWQVLDKKDGKALVISKYALECKKYNETRGETNWENCTLRKWLNEEFIGKAFSGAEASRIVAERIAPFSAKENATEDRMFLLSCAEAKRYFSKDALRACEPTAYAVSVGAYMEWGKCIWLLRSPGRDWTTVANVANNGSIFDLGEKANTKGRAIRPVCWIKL